MIDLLTTRLRDHLDAWSQVNQWMVNLDSRSHDRKPEVGRPKIALDAKGFQTTYVVLL
jgi:hypothetical protein